MVVIAVGDLVKARAIKEEFGVLSNGHFSIIHAFHLAMGGFCLRSPNGKFRQLSDLDFASPDEANEIKVTAHPEDSTATEEAPVTSRIEGRFQDLRNFNEIADLGAANGSRASFNFDHANNTEEISVTSYAKGHFHDLENSGNLGESNASSDLDASGKILVEDWIDKFMMFNEDDIFAVSKADSLTKMITCFQALWFVTQVVSRLVENRAVTLLEVSTCAYVFSAFITYLCWWKKPQNCSVPLMIDCSNETIEKSSGSTYEEFEGTWREYLWGASWLELGEEHYLYTTLSITFLGFPVFFGAIHVAAWNNTLPSQVEVWMWRSSTLLCSVISLLFIACLYLFFILDKFREIGRDRLNDILFYTMFSLYVVVRIYMIFEVFFSMRALPHSAYSTVSWSAAVPHI